MTVRTIILFRLNGVIDYDTRENNDEHGSARLLIILKVELTPGIFVKIDETEQYRRGDGTSDRPIYIHW
jgi:hypothetical protein